MRARFSFVAFKGLCTTSNVRGHEQSVLQFDFRAFPSTRVWKDGSSKTVPTPTVGQKHVKPPPSCMSTIAVDFFEDQRLLKLGRIWYSFISARLGAEIGLLASSDGDIF